MTDEARQAMIQKLILSVCYAVDESKWPRGDGSINIQDIHAAVSSVFREAIARGQATTPDEICDRVRREVLQGPDACLAFLRRHMPITEVA